MKTKIIGITGGVGSGKTELLHYIKNNFHCEVVLSDLVAKEMYEPGSECFSRIVELLGADILDGNGSITREKMAEKIFTDQTLLSGINAIVHPAVIQNLRNRIEEARRANQLDFFFVESALLIEAHFDEICDELWYIFTEEAVRRKRLAASRNYSDEKITQIISNQLPEEVFRATCKVVIDNSHTLEESEKQIASILEGYKCQK